MPADDPAWVIVSQLADPQWTARWIGLDGQGELDGEILPTFRKASQPGGWQRIEVPASGRWTLRLEYDAHDVAEGAAISTVAWLSWMLAAIFAAFQAGAAGPCRGETRPRRNVTTKIGVAIVGASGYAARELIGILLSHPHVRITAATSRQDEAPRLDVLHPSLARRIDLTCEVFDADRIAERASFAFLALPHTASMAVVPALAPARRAGHRL